MNTPTRTTSATEAPAPSRIRLMLFRVTRVTLNNIKRILEGAGASVADVVRVGVFMADGSEFAKMNEVYAEFFGADKPARTTIVCKFAADIKIEIDCVAYSPKK